MKPNQLRGLGTGVVLFFGGVLSLNVVSSVTIAALRLVNEAKQKKLASPCVSCKGKGFYVCKLCGGSAAIRWSPLRDPIAINPCVCPTCDGNRVEHSLVRPSKADPESRRNWRRLERQRDMSDLLSTLQSSFWEESDEEGDGNGTLPAGDRGWLRAFLVLIQVFRPVSGSRSSRSWMAIATYRTMAHMTNPLSKISTSLKPTNMKKVVKSFVNV